MSTANSTAVGHDADGLLWALEAEGGALLERTEMEEWFRRSRRWGLVLGIALVLAAAMLGAGYFVARRSASTRAASESSSA